MPIYKRNKNYQVKINYTANGEKKRHVKTFPTKAEAKAYENWKTTELTSESYNPTKELLFTDYYDQWLEQHFKQGLAERSIQSFVTVQHLVHKYFEGIKLRDITRQTYQEFIYWLAESRKPRTVHNYHIRVAVALSTAFHDGIITIDPTFKIKTPRNNDDPEAEKTLNTQQTKRLMEYIENQAPDRYLFAIYTSLQSGLRMGEVLALELADFNRLKNTLSVTKSRTTVKPYKVTKPKTKSSKRVITMSDRYFEELFRYVDAFANDIAPFLLTEDITPRTLNRRLEDVLTEIDAPIITFHGLRHTHASFLINNHVDISYVSKRLGHASISITQQVYFHLFQDRYQDEDDKAMDLLG